MASYRFIRFVAYEIDTSPAQDVQGKFPYWGDPDIDADIDARCCVMARAMAIAADKVPKDMATLNIFMAPEFYFRGPKGAYPMEKSSGIMDDCSMQYLPKRQQRMLWVAASKKPAFGLSSNERFF